MTYSLSYRSSRAEVWRFYWRLWRARLWPLHLLVACVAAVVCASTLSNPPSFRSYALWLLGSLPLVTLAFAMWPQLKFKPQERTLRVGPDGWSTHIGNQSGSRPWSGISSVQQHGDTVQILSTTGNALIVPLRAFDGSAQMQQFLQDAQAWHREHAA